MRLAEGLPLSALTSLIYAQPNPSVAPGTMCPDGAYVAGTGVSPPSVMVRTSCEMPDLARKLRAQGDVTLSLIVKADGSVRDIQIVRSAGYGMDERAALIPAAIAAVKQWRYHPIIARGQPSEARTVVNTPFRPPE